MPATSYLYPANPINVPPSITQPSTAFKKEVTSVLGSIVFFFIVYIVLFLLSIALVIGCVYGGFAIIINMPKLITIFAGLGLIGVGVMVFVFLVKFLFSVSKYDRSDIIEVTEEEQPALFAFIRQLTSDTQTRFPKKIYLSADVNACVFYDSSFWSMFFPIKKNLQIGLGMVNGLNISEFKAVMAHEFGHFSQRSMKLGSFVYNVNKIIHNMLYENKGYADFLSSWASIDGVFAFFASITAKIAQGIQWLLRQMYGFINKTYMRLSREMEFHADAVAASVSGSRSLVTALRRVELANSGYSIALQKCDELFRQKKISNNIYQNHTTVLLHLADEFKLPLQNGLPIVNDDFIAGNNLTRVNFKDQWASHPTTEDREKHLNSLAIIAEECTEPAWVLFRDPETLQAQLTQKVYESVSKDNDIVTVGNNDFSEKLEKDVQHFTLPEAYNGFYDERQIVMMDMEQVITNREVKVAGYSELLSTENSNLPKRINAAITDMEVLKAIAEKRVQTKSFDFDGVKYNRSDALNIATQLEKEHKELKDKLEQLDKQVVQFFYQQALQKDTSLAADLKNQYGFYFQQRSKADDFLKDMNEMLNSLQPIFAGQAVSIDEINPMIGNLKSIHEAKFKQHLNYWMSVGVFKKEQEGEKRILDFINSKHEYFSGSSFFDNELTLLHTLCNDSWGYVNKWLFEKFKHILEIQLELVGVNGTEKVN